jgi:hypothetical protein
MDYECTFFGRWNGEIWKCQTALLMIFSTEFSTKSHFLNMAPLERTAFSLNFIDCILRDIVVT